MKVRDESLPEFLVSGLVDGPFCISDCIASDGRVTVNDKLESL
jgi:hypothetical protein